MEPNAPEERSSTSGLLGGAHFGRYLLIGFFTVAPLWVTWLVFDFLLGILAGAGGPLLRASARAVAPFSETLASWLLDSSFQKAVAVLLTLVALYLIGLLASLVLGRKLIAAMEGMLGRLPLVQTIYGGTKRFLHSLRKPPVSGQRVVLISFPTPEMKAVGLVTKILRDEESGRELAAVYVPTSPNPTSGYIEIVPIEELVQTDWTLEQAMSFVMTGGANAPDHVRFRTPAAPEGERAER
jgi:uncharacterized membrane protein